MKAAATALLVCAMAFDCRADTSTPVTPEQEHLPFLRTEGLHIVNERGEPVALRGYNLGSWLLLEPWMVKLDGQEGVLAEKDIWDQLATRFGEDKMHEAVAAHRESFIAEMDIENLHRLGVNFVRVPIWWRVLGDKTYDPDGWQYVDRLLDWCEKRGIYVLLDLHGAPGGQNTGANILGERPDGTYWATNSPHRAETLDWWRSVAKRYAGRSVVAGYDLLNEAWGASPHVDLLVHHMDEIYRAIRQIDPKHMMFVEDALQGYHRLPRPADVGWQNVVYSFHFYPENGSQFPQRDLAGVRAAQMLYGVPVHIGEFNIFNAARGGVSLIDRCLDVFNSYDWAWTLWSYKVLEDNADYFWGLTGYTAQRLPGISLKTSSFDDIAGYFRRDASANFQEQPLLRACLEQRLKQQLTSRPTDDPLSPLDATIIASTPGALHVEWQWAPPNLGFWTPADSAAWKVTVPRDGVYRLDLVYATGTNDAKALLYVDGVAAGSATLKPTGDWARYKRGSVPCGKLDAGPHVLRLACSGGDAFLNLREANLVAADDASVAKTTTNIELTPAEITAFQRKGHICVEWQNSPPNIGHWNDGDAVVFRFHLANAGTFVPSFWWSSPNQRVRVRVDVNGRDTGTFDLAGTGDWHRYEWQRAAQGVKLAAGEVELKLTAVEVTNESGAGNLRAIKLAFAPVE